MKNTGLQEKRGLGLELKCAAYELCDPGGVALPLCALVPLLALKDNKDYYSWHGGLLNEAKNLKYLLEWPGSFYATSRWAHCELFGARKIAGSAKKGR